jgi:hypothetical protein
MTQEMLFSSTATLGATAAVKASLEIPLIKSGFFVADCAKGWLFVVATFENPNEPLVYGFGISEKQAWRFAKSVDAPANAVLCKRIPASDPVWQSPTGMLVTLEHLQAVRKE